MVSHTPYGILYGIGIRFVFDTVSMHTNKLTHTQVKNAKPRARAYKLYDGQQSYLLVKPTGTRAWRLDYKHADRRKTQALGTYPEVSLQQFRSKRSEALSLIVDGIDPAEDRRQVIENEAAQGFTFSEVITDWLARMRTGGTINVLTGKKSKPWAPSTFEGQHQRIESNLMPYLGHKSFLSVNQADLNECLDKVSDRGSSINAQKIAGLIKQIYRDERVCELMGAEDAMRKVGGNIPCPPRRPKNHAAATSPEDLTIVLRLMDEHPGKLIVKTALRLTPLLLLRPGELRHLRWIDVRLADRQLVIPASRIGFGDDLPEGVTPQRGLKSGEADLVVPLPHQALALFERLKTYTGDGGYVFPSARCKVDDPIQQQRPMSENSVNKALRSVGIDNTQQTAHGFRATARTLLSERINYSAEVIERQLSHDQVDDYGGAYARMQFIEQRTQMMQDWADFIDGLRTSEKVVNFEQVDSIYDEDNSEHSVVRSTVKIAKKDKPGLIEHHALVYPDTEQGAIQSWKEAARTVQPRQELMRELEAIEAHAQRMAFAGDCPRQSTLDKIKTDVMINGKQHTNVRLAGSDAESGSLLRLAYDMEASVNSLRGDIEHFEKHTTDEGNLNRFHTGMRRAVAMVFDMRVLTIKQNELEILRGAEEQFNHGGLTRCRQKQAVKRVGQLTADAMSQGNSKKKAGAAAIKTVAAEYHVTIQAVYSWLKKQN